MNHRTVYEKVKPWVKIALIIALILLPSFFVILVKGGNETNRPTINQARRVVNAYEDGTFYEDRIGVSVAENARNVYAGFLFENFNISGDSRIDNATLTLYYYNNLDYGTNNTFILVEGILGSPLTLDWDTVVNGYDTASYVSYNVSTWTAEGYFTINVTDIIQEMVLLPTYQAGDNFLIRTFHLAPTGPGADPTYYHYDVKSNFEPEAVKRPSLQIGWTPGIFYQGYEITPTPGGIVGNPIGYYDHFGSNRESILVFNSSTGQLIANNTQAPGRFFDLTDSEMIMINNTIYAVNRSYWLIRSRNGGVNWTGIAEMDTDVSNPAGPFALTYDYSNNMIHVAYHQDIDLKYCNVSLTTNTSNTIQAVATGNPSYDDFRSLWIDYWEGNGTIVIARAGELVSTEDRLIIYENVNDSARAWYGANIRPEGSCGIMNGKVMIHNSIGNYTITIGQRDDSGQTQAVAYVRSHDIGTQDIQSIPNLAGDWSPIWQTNGEKNDKHDHLIYPNRTVIGVYLRRSQVGNWAPALGITHYPYSTFSQARNWNASTPAHHWINLMMQTIMFNGNTTDQDPGGVGDYLYFWHNRQTDTGQIPVGLYETNGIPEVNTSYKVATLLPHRVTGLGAVSSLVGKLNMIDYTVYGSTPAGSNYTAPPGVDPSCVENYLTQNYGNPPYTQTEIENAIDFCTDWIPPDPGIDPVDYWSTSLRAFKLYFLLIGLAFIITPWIAFALSGEYSWIGAILVMNTLGIALIIEFMRL